MRAFMGGDLSMVGSSISLVHRAEVIAISGSDYTIQSVVVNPSPEVAAQVQLFLQSGVLRGLGSSHGGQPARHFMDRMRLWVGKWFGDLSVDTWPLTLDGSRATRTLSHQSPSHSAPSCYQLYTYPIIG
ncbi:hypothetical protein DL95DRAFT_386762 [Leptodontidium sp. 2 PMI_412]|nr:hypothetical protein DL95DRAFT_386762 [Leptodontidium sp. 2 PMI_412]